MRYLFAMTNRAMVVTEPTYQHAPFESGKHIVVAPPEAIADKIAYYLSHEDEREAIANQAYEHITTQLTLHQSMARIFEQAKQKQTQCNQN